VLQEEELPEARRDGGVAGGWTIRVEDANRSRYVVNNNAMYEEGFVEMWDLTITLASVPKSHYWLGRGNRKTLI